MINEKLERGFPTLIVDTGNFCRGKSRTSNLKADYLAKAMSLMSYDAINVAGEEITLGSNRILELREKNRLPLLSSNLYRREGDRNLIHPYLIKRIGSSRFLGFEHGGVKVGIVGLAGEESWQRMGRQIPPDLLVPKPEDILPATVEKLRGHCDLVIVLSDMDLKTATRLAQEVGGIDLFFIGQGAKAKHYEQIDGTIFVLPASSGNELGDVELVLDDQNRVTSHQVQWTLLDKSVPDDEELAQLVAEYKAKAVERRQPPPRPKEK